MSDGADGTETSSARHSALISAGILLSRLLGLARQALIATYLGAGVVSDAFNTAFRLTNILQNLFGEGALSASFIPVYARAREAAEANEDADRIAGAVAAILALVSAVIVVAGVLATPYFVTLIVPLWEGEKRELTIRLTRILFPGAGIFVLSAWCLGILNSHSKFFLSYAAPVFWNLAMIAALVGFGPRRGEVDLAVIIAWASVAGAVLQMAVQVPTVLRLLEKPRFALDFGYPPVRTVLRNFVPAFISRGVVQISGFIDIYIAGLIAAHGVVTLLQNAQAIYILPISLFGMAVSAAALPEMSRASGTNEELTAKLRAMLDEYLSRVAFFVVPSSVAFLVLGDAISGVLLEHGKFSPEDSARTWAILAGSALGLVASALGRLYSSTFYALRDSATPLRYSLVRIFATAILGYFFALKLPPLLGLEAWTGAAGLTVSGGLAAWIEFLLLRRGIENRVGKTGIATALLAKVWLCALLGGGAGYLIMRFGPDGFDTTRSAAAIAAFAIVYGAATIALGIPEAKRIAARVRRR